MGALVNGVFLFGMGILVFWMGAMRLQNLIDLPTTPMLIAAAGGLVTEIISVNRRGSDRAGCWPLCLACRNAFSDFWAGPRRDRGRSG